MIPNTGEVRRRRVAHARGRLGDVAERFAGRPLVLSSCASVAWATGAISSPIDRVAATDPVWVVYRDGEMTLVTSSVEFERLSADYDLDDLGFDLVSAPWYEEHAHRRRVEALVGTDCASDVEGLGVDATFELTRARLGLCGAEIEVLGGLSRVASDAVEAVLDQWRPGESSDREIAAQVARHLETYGAEAVCLIVGADERLSRFRHPLMRGDVTRRSVMVVVVARALGLHVALTRLASVEDEIDESLMERCELVHERVRDATRVGATWGDLYSALAQGYREVGQPDAWREPVAAGCAIAFNPSLAGGAKIEDTYVVGGDELTCLTSSPRWPRPAGANTGAGVLRLREEKAT